MKKGNGFCSAMGVWNTLTIVINVYCVCSKNILNTFIVNIPTPFYMHRSLYLDVKRVMMLCYVKVVCVSFNICIAILVNHMVFDFLMKDAIFKNPVVSPTIEDGWINMVAICLKIFI